MKVSEIMSRKPQFITTRNTLNEAANLMWKHDLGSLPIVDEDNHVVGMITDRDIAMAAFTQGKPLSDITVSTSMSAQLFCCGVNDDVGLAEDLMQQHQVRRIPVLGEDGRLAGILSINDIAVTYASKPRKGVKAEAVANTLAAICRHRPHSVTVIQVA